MEQSVTHTIHLFFISIENKCQGQRMGGGWWMKLHSTKVAFIIVILFNYFYNKIFVSLSPRICEINAQSTTEVTYLYQGESERVRI